MFATIGRTWNLAKMSWGVLMKDRELLLFPIMSLISIIVVAAVFGGIALATGSFDHISASGEAKEDVRVIDVTILVLFSIAVAFVGIFFNAALVAGALERLRGGDPTVGSALRATLPHTPNILGWAIISASVGLILRALRDRTDNMLGRLVLSLIGGVWAYMTFFVVPVLVVKGVGPIGAIKESAGLFKRTWGEQVTANFGFGIFYLGVFLLAAIPVAIVFALNVIAGIIVAVIVGVTVLSVVAALEGIFKAALYEYAAEGIVPKGFEAAELGSSYQPR
jgi:hypothetical protein